MHRVLAVLALALAATLLLGAQPSATPRPITIGYSQCNRGEPWREQMDKDIVASCGKHTRIKLLKRDARNDVGRQIAHIEEFIAAKVDAIIISPKDTSLTKVVADAHTAGIPVIVLDRRVDGDGYTCFIGADNKLIGREAGKWAVKKLGGKGNIVELKGLASSPPAPERSEPFREQLKGTQIRIVYDADMEWLGDKARAKMEAALARNPQKGSIQLVYGANDPAAIAAHYAAKDAGREKEMIFVGVDALPHEGVQAVRSGVLDATFEYPNGAVEAVDAVLKIADGKGAEVPRAITLGTRLFTKDNVDKGGEPIKP